MHAEDGADLSDGGPDPVDEQRERQLHDWKPRPVTHPSGLPEPTKRGVALRRGQAGKEVDGGGKAVTLGRRA